MSGREVRKRTTDRIHALYTVYTHPQKKKIQKNQNLHPLVALHSRNPLVFPPYPQPGVLGLHIDWCITRRMSWCIKNVFGTFSVPYVRGTPYQHTTTWSAHIHHRKNRPRSRYPFRRGAVSVITECAGVRGTPLYIHSGLRADRGETP